MSDFDDNELDKAFRANFEGRGMPVPPSVWATVRAKSLERQLMQAKAVTTWLKGLSALLGTGLAVTLYLLGSQSDRAVPNVPVQRITHVKTDTIYLTRTLPAAGHAATHPVSSNPSRNPVPDKLPTTSPPPISNDPATTAPLLTNSPAPGKKATQTLSSKPEQAATEKQVYGRPLADFPEVAISQPGARRPNEEMPSGKISGFTTELPPTTRTGSINQPSATQPLVAAPDNAPNKQPVLTGSEATKRPFQAVSERETREGSVALKPLVALSIPHAVQFKLPAMSGRKVYRPTLSKLTTARVSAAKELTISGYYSPESLLFMERHDNHSGNVHDESEHQSGQTVGVRVGLRIASKWHVLGGLEYNQSVLDKHRDTEYLTAGLVNGTPAFTYPTPFGGAVIPASQLAFVPKQGDELTIQNQWDIRGSRWRMPLVVRYDFWTKPVRSITAFPLQISVYGLAGGALSLSQRQGIRLSVTGPDLLTTLVRVPAAAGWQPAIDVQASVGVAAGLGQHLSLFAEPTYGRALTRFGTTQNAGQNLGYLGLRLGVSYRVRH